ncbi:MAG: ribosomal L7Ae/L30e/S12e/Gadd45 family protein [Candidatus Woesearchaeota archaeon]
MAEDVISEIKKAVETGKAIIGKKATLKALRAGRLSKVFITSNCPKDLKETIERYSLVAKTEIIRLPFPNTELGTVCRKPFSVSVIGYRREK